jgi:hypothetical protein
LYRYTSCDAHGAVASVVRRAAMRHGLRGANAGVDQTLDAVRREPMGTPAVVGLYKLNPVVTHRLKPPGFNP